LCHAPPTQASGPKPEFCKWSLPPRHSGERVAKAESDVVSMLGVDAPVFSFSANVADVPEAAVLREAKYTAIGSLSPEAISAPRLAATRTTVARHAARSFVRSKDRAASWHLVQLRSKAAVPALTTAGSNFCAAAEVPAA